MLILRLLAVFGSIWVMQASAAEKYRDAHQRAAFVKSHPCPSTGRGRGACPGYVVDHIKPLCAGGEDHPRNMQWQTVADAKIKDRKERAICKHTTPQSHH